MADLRHVSMERAVAAGVVLQWQADLEPAPELTARQQYQLRAALNEALSNALRHAQARNILVSWQQQQGELSVTLTDDGQGMPPTGDAPGGLGLESIRTRMQEIGAAAAWARPEHGGTSVRLSLPQP